MSLFYTHVLGRNLNRNTGCVTNAAFYSMVHISRGVFLYPRQIDCELACDWVRHLDCVNIITRPGVHPLHSTLTTFTTSRHPITSHYIQSFPFIVLQRIENQKTENMFQYSLDMLLCIRAVTGTLRNFTVPERKVFSDVLPKKNIAQNALKWPAT